MIRWDSPYVRMLLIYLILLFGKSDKLFPALLISESDSNSFGIEITFFDLPIYYPSTCVQFYRDGIIYLVDSKISRESQGEYIPFGSNSMYYSPLRDNKFDRQIYFLRREPFPYPADAVSFTADYSKIFFTKESRFRGYRDYTVRIYEAGIRINKNGKSELVDKPIEFPFNSQIYSCVQPSISPDGKYLIFASDMAGGMGGLDLYYSIYRDGSWEDPINLGKDVNSELDDCFSFIDKKGNLYFSSNGHNGYGEYDIYFSKLIKKYHWDKPMNMGPRLNSVKDDVAFILSRNDETQGFFASDRNVSGKQYQVFKLTFSGNITSKSQDQLLADISKSLLSEEKPKDNSETEIITSAVPAETTNNPQNTEIEKPEVIPAELEQKIDGTEVRNQQVNNHNILFRVQFRTSVKSLGSLSIIIDDRVYKTFEYFYKGAYRYTVGAFENLNEAVNFCQNCRKEYPQAFVAAFRDSERVLDPDVFKK